MTATSERLYWWLGTDEPPAVKAVLSVAALRQDETDPVHDAACLVYGAHAGTVRELADTLSVIEDLDAGYPSDREALSRALHAQVVGGVADGDCEREAERLRAEAVTTAQLVASVARIGRAA